MVATTMNDQTYHTKELCAQFSATWKIAALYATVIFSALVTASLAKFSNALVLSPPIGVMRESNPKRSDTPAYPAPPRTIEAKSYPLLHSLQQLNTLFLSLSLKLE